MPCRILEAHVIFFAGDNSVRSLLDGFGRTILTCGMLFQVIDHNKQKILDCFFADSMSGCFQNIYGFSSRSTSSNIEGYFVDWGNIRGISVSSEPSLVEKLYNLCRACHSTVKGYNQVDRVCSALLPFFNPEDKKDVFAVQHFHSAQAVVLILRECLASSHPFVCRLNSVNSRSVTPEALHNILLGLGSPHEMCVLKIP